MVCAVSALVIYNRSARFEPRTSTLASCTVATWTSRFSFHPLSLLADLYKEGQLLSVCFPRLVEQGYSWHLIFLEEFRYNGSTSMAVEAYLNQLPDSLFLHPQLDVSSARLHLPFQPVNNQWRAALSQHDQIAFIYQLSLLVYCPRKSIFVSVYLSLS